MSDKGKAKNLIAGQEIVYVIRRWTEIEFKGLTLLQLHSYKITPSCATNLILWNS